MPAAMFGVPIEIRNTVRAHDFTSLPSQKPRSGTLCVAMNPCILVHDINQDQEYGACICSCVRVHDVKLFLCPCTRYKTRSGMKVRAHASLSLYKNKSGLRVLVECGCLYGFMSPQCMIKVLCSGADGIFFQMDPRPEYTSITVGDYLNIAVSGRSATE